MSNMKYCPNCQRNVNVEHSWSGGGLAVTFLIGLFTLFLPFLIYVAIKWGRRCPICHTPEKMLYAPWFPPAQGTINQSIGQQPPQGRYP